MQTAIYMRVSTTQQASEGQSLEAQEKILKDYAASHPNIIIVDTYVDDGISGTKFDQRDELQRLLSDVKSGKINLILFTKLDRFFRSVRHLMNTLDTLERYGCELKALEKPVKSDTRAIEELLKLNVLEIYKTLSNAQKRRLWGAVIKSITPRDGSFFIEYM